MQPIISVSSLAGSASRGFSRLDEVPPAWRTTLRLVIFGLSALLTQTFFWSNTAPVVLKVAVGGVAVLSALRPDAGLLVVAGLVPFGRIIGVEVFDAYPAHFTEALVLACLAGWLASRLRKDPGGAHSSVSMMVTTLSMTTIAPHLQTSMQSWHRLHFFWSIEGISAT